MLVLKWIVKTIVGDGGCGRGFSDIEVEIAGKNNWTIAVELAGILQHFHQLRAAHAIAAAFKMEVVHAERSLPDANMT